MSEWSSCLPEIPWPLFWLAQNPWKPGAWGLSPGDYPTMRGRSVKNSHRKGFQTHCALSPVWNLVPLLPSRAGLGSPIFLFV